MSRIKLILAVLELVLPSNYIKATLWKVSNVCILKEVLNLQTALATSNHGVITGKKYVLEKKEHGGKLIQIFGALSRQLVILIIKAPRNKVCQYIKGYTFLT